MGTINTSMQAVQQTQADLTQVDDLPPLGNDMVSWLGGKGKTVSPKPTLAWDVCSFSTFRLSQQPFRVSKCFRAYELNSPILAIFCVSCRKVLGYPCVSWPFQGPIALLSPRKSKPDTGELCEIIAFL